MSVAFDPDAYIRSSIDAGRSMRQIARDIGCERIDIYRRIRVMGLHGREPILEPAQAKAIGALVADIGRPNNPLHAVMIRAIAESVIAARCSSPEETEKMVVAVASAINRLVHHPDISVTMKRAS